MFDTSRRCHAARSAANTRHGCGKAGKGIYHYGRNCTSGTHHPRCRGAAAGAHLHPGRDERSLRPLSRERSKYADYDDLKAKAQQFDAAQEAGKTELQKANEKAAKLQEQLDSMTKANTLRELRGKVGGRHRCARRTAFRRHRGELHRTSAGHPQVCTARLPQHPGRRRSPQQTHRLHPPAVC